MQGARNLNTQRSEHDPDHEAHVEIEECRQKRRKVADLEELSFDHAARNGINRRRPAPAGLSSPAWITQYPCHTLSPRRLMLGSITSRYVSGCAANVDVVRRTRITAAFIWGRPSSRRVSGSSPRLPMASAASGAGGSRQSWQCAPLSTATSASRKHEAYVKRAPAVWRP